jgi:hypothetical protein
MMAMAMMVMVVVVVVVAMMGQPWAHPSHHPGHQRTGTAGHPLHHSKIISILCYQPLAPFRLV